MKILMVLTSHDELGDTGKKTGFWLEEFAAPYYVFKDAGAEITLAPKEFEVLSYLVVRRGEAVSRQELMDAIWGDAYVAISRSLDVHMTSLRAKLARPNAIATIRGYGYRWSY